MRSLCVVCLSLFLVACGEEGAQSPSPEQTPNNDPNNAPMPEPEPTPEPEPVPEPDPTPDPLPDPVDPACDTAGGALPEGLTELSWDDGEMVGDVTGQTWSIVGQVLSEAELYEVVRFELAHPARIHGISVQFGALPEAPDKGVGLGIFGDFGYNGFDFWQFDPLWEGMRCSGNLASGQWSTYVLDEPVEVLHPGLVYAGHRRGPGDASIGFDGTTAPDCEEGTYCCQGFDDCHSAFNFPELRDFTFDGQAIYAWNGLSLGFELDYMVRLHVEYLIDPDPIDEVFGIVDGVSPGNRAAWGDYDNDGDDDLFTSGPRLFENEGGGFVDVTEASGLTASGASGSGVWGDYDNDGCLDVFVFDGSNSRDDHLLRNNCDGTFSDVTEEAGITDQREHHDCNGNDRAPTPAAAWWDIDGDGFVDLYLANYECGANGTYYPDNVWRNTGEGTFEEWTGQRGFLGVDSLRYAGRGAAPIDFDMDGDVDLMVNNYRLNENLFYVNNGDGTVSRNDRDLGLSGIGTRLGLRRVWGHSIGAAWGDLNSDGRFDLVVANLAHPRFYDFSDKSQVLLAQEDFTFVDIQGDFERPEGAAGLRYQETHSVPVLADFDHDGHLDLVISAVYDGRPTDFYWGVGDGTFELDSYRAGLRVTNGWGMAVADIDMDGDLDLAASGVLYEKRGAPQGHWFQVRAVGNVSSNRAALGATVRIEAGDFVRIRHVGGGTGQGCQDSLNLHFGLGEVESVDRVVVQYPGGESVTYEGPFEVDQRLWVYEDGVAEVGWAGEP